MDTRTRREKLEAMASQTVSPNEADNARRLLDAAPPPETSKVLTRDAILATPGRNAPATAVRVYDRALGAYVVVDVDDAGAWRHVVEDFDRSDVLDWDVDD